MMADLISEHEFEPWEWSNGEVVCQYFDPERPTRGTCDRPRKEHALPEVSGEPLEDGEGVVAGGEGPAHGHDGYSP
jgi:hypothetical protein